MKKFSANIFWILLIILAISSEVYLLNHNLALRKRVSRIDKLKAQLIEAQYEGLQNRRVQQIEGTDFPLSSEAMLSGTAASFKSKYLVLFYFLFDGCDACVRDEILTWNQFAKQYDSQRRQVIGITEAQAAVTTLRLRKSMKINFPVVAIDSLGSKLEEYGISTTPAVLFRERESKKCVYAFFPSPREKSQAGFVNKLQRFLNCQGHKRLSGIN